MKKIIISFITVIGMIACLPTFSLNSDKLLFPINVLIPTRFSQNAFNYIPSNLPARKPLLTTKQAKEKSKQFLKRYFFAWSPKDKQMIYYVTGDNTKPEVTVNVAVTEKQVTKKCQKQACYNINYMPIHHIPNHVILNMDLQHLPNVSCSGNNAACYGIMVKNSVVRALPTEHPFFASPTKPGEGYPFDYLQDGDLWFGAPVKIIQHSRDKQWLLVKGQGMLGWVKRDRVAHANAVFRNKLENAPHFMTPIQKRTTFYSGHPTHGTHSLRIYLGSIFPLFKKENHTSIIGIPVANTDGNAAFKPLTVLNDHFLPWPLKTTPFNFSLLLNQMVDMPYGWSGLHFDSDCSGTLTRIFTAFGIWLSPWSLVQGQFGGKIYGIPKEKRKQWLIKSKGAATLMPYLTLITLGHKPNHISHVMLYLGTPLINGKRRAMVFQEAWGIHIHLKDSKQNSLGRAIYGRAVITSISEGVNLLKAFQSKGLTLSSLWNYPTFNVTLLNQKPQPLPQIHHPAEWNI